MAGVKKSRTIALDETLEVKLVALCANLGVTPHSYLLNEIGKCVSRDYLQFQVAANNQKALSGFMANLEGKLDLAEIFKMVSHGQAMDGENPET